MIDEPPCPAPECTSHRPCWRCRKNKRRFRSELGSEVRRLRLPALMAKYDCRLPLFDGPRSNEED